mmetsp:Transcript_98921/g.308250  ORF Transcript_98921/g.308250 Transcript_98921/m.308250 type:complete len:246 (-) Transcript_98921:182-919(-)
MASDLSEFVLVADPIECLRLAREASAVEGVAMQQDLQGEAVAAAETYRQAVAKLHEALRACPEGHPDGRVLERHAREVLARVEYLEGLDGCVARVPLEEHILCVQLTLGSAPSGPCAFGGEGAATKVMGAAAAISGATGLLVLGPLSGAALGVAAALASRREDQAGCMARSVGNAGLQLYCKARAVDREHRISDRVASVGGSVMHGAVVKARSGLGQLGERHRLLGKLGRASTTLANVALKAVVA